MNEKLSRMTFTDKVLTKIIIKIIRMRSTTGRPQLADIQPCLRYAGKNSRLNFFFPPVRNQSIHLYLLVEALQLIVTQLINLWPNYTVLTNPSRERSFLKRRLFAFEWK